MYHFLGKKATIKPEFPERVDLPFLTDKEANAALCLLRLLVEGGAADVYTQPYTPPGERPRWNVWLNEQIVPGGKRWSLREWAARAVCRQYEPDGGAA